MTDKMIPGEIVKEIGRVANEYNYQGTQEDQQVIRSCVFAVPLFQMLYGVVGAGATWTITKAKPFERYRGARLFAAVVTGLAAGELSKEHSMGFCLRELMRLPTPLGGEVAALMRERDPNHPYLRDVPQRMDGDPKARIATEEAKQSAAERAQYADSKAASGSDSASVNASDGTAGSVPAWDFEPVMEPVAADVSPSQQQHQHSSRRERRRHRESGLQHGDQPADELLKDYFDSRWDEPQAPR